MRSNSTRRMMPSIIPPFRPPPLRDPALRIVASRLARLLKFGGPRGPGFRNRPDLPPNIIDLNASEVLACMRWDITAYHRVQVVKLARHFKISYHPQIGTRGV